jgi:hypothetical protein
VVEGNIVGNATNPVLIFSPGGLITTTRTVSERVPVTEVRVVTVRVPQAGCGYVLRQRTFAVTVYRTVVKQISIEVRDVAQLDHLTVGGSVENANVEAGAGGNIKTVHVKEDWVASSLAAGIDPGMDGYFGTPDDTVLTGGLSGRMGTIHHILIDGQASGTPDALNSMDHFGFVAQEVKALKVHGVAFPLTPGPNNDDLPVGTTGDLRVREVGP